MILTSATVIALVLCLQYVACVVLHHANPRRTNITILVDSELIRRSVKLLACCALMVSVFLSASLQGWERGVPIWLCLISVAGFVSLYISAYAPSKHLTTGIAAFIATLFFSAALLVLGDSGASQGLAQMRSTL